MTFPIVQCPHMSIDLYDHQIEGVDKLENGSILCGGVGSGKSRTALAYFHVKVGQGQVKANGIGQFTKMRKPKDLYIITTAKKRDSLDWETEAAHFLLSTKIKSLNNTIMVVDSWNNIKKYADVKNAFFIFDEQRLVGSGAWVKSFLKIAKRNQWILLSATPGDTWIDYIPVFVANGFYKNRTEFLRRHAVYSRFTKYPQIEKFMEEGVLLKLREKILVPMRYQRHTISHHKTILCRYDEAKYQSVLKDRWNPYEDKPIKTISELCYLLRKVVNNDIRRCLEIIDIHEEKKRLIVFYNFDYELVLLRSMCECAEYKFTEWNGHNHDPIPDGDDWVYLVQYTAGAEGWNCIATDTIVFYSQNYSYKIMVQAAGRIDRLNSRYKDLYYYHLRSNASIDIAIHKAIETKKNFNMLKFAATERRNLK